METTIEIDIINPITVVQITIPPVLAGRLVMTLNRTIEPIKIPAATKINASKDGQMRATTKSNRRNIIIS